MNPINASSRYAQIINAVVNERDRNKVYADAIDAEMRKSVTDSRNKFKSCKSYSVKYVG